MTGVREICIVCRQKLPKAGDVSIMVPPQGSGGPIFKTHIGCADEINAAWEEVQTNNIRSQLARAVLRCFDR